MGGGKRTRERALPKNSGPLQMVCSVVEFCTGKTEQRHPRGVENVRCEGGPNPLLGGVSFVRVFPLFFHPPRRPLKSACSNGGRGVCHIWGYLTEDFITSYVLSLLLRVLRCGSLVAPLYNKQPFLWRFPFCGLRVGQFFLVCTPPLSRKSKRGHSKWGLKVLVHNCPRLPTMPYL